MCSNIPIAKHPHHNDTNNLHNPEPNKGSLEPLIFPLGDHEQVYQKLANRCQCKPRKYKRVQCRSDIFPEYAHSLRRHNAIESPRKEVRTNHHPDIHVLIPHKHTHSTAHQQTHIQYAHNSPEWQIVEAAAPKYSAQWIRYAADAAS